MKSIIIEVTKDMTIGDVVKKAGKIYCEEVGIYKELTEEMTMGEIIRRAMTTGGMYRKVKVEEKPKRWRAEKGDMYWRKEISANEGVVVDQTAEVYDEIDNHNFNVGNYFKTEAEATASVSELKAWAKVKGYILDRNAEEEWEADWGNDENNKWEIYFDNNNQNWQATGAQLYQSMLTLPYTTKEIAQEVIDKFREELNLIKSL